MFDVELYVSSIPTLLTKYSNLPIPKNRIVAVIYCSDNTPLSVNTVKSLLNQSVRLSDIAVETKNPKNIPDELKNVVTIHKLDTVKLRETESDTIIISVNNGTCYGNDYVENEINERMQNSLKIE